MEGGHDEFPVFKSDPDQFNQLFARYEAGEVSIAELKGQVEDSVDRSMAAARGQKHFGRLEKAAKLQGLVSEEGADLGQWLPRIWSLNNKRTKNRCFVVAQIASQHFSMFAKVPKVLRRDFAR